MKSVWRISGAASYLAVVFLNAFVDLGHKITIQNTVFKIYDGTEQVVLTAIVNGLILLPFILLFTPAGLIADRYPKNRVMRIAAWFAVVITLAITACYYLGWFWPAFMMTFLLAVQSAIYSPAKYGYIKVLFGTDHLAEGNGIVQATTIIAILLGTFAFSILFESRFPEGANDTGEVLLAVAPIGWLLVINSLLELVLAYRIPTLESGQPALKLSPRDYLRGKSTRVNLQPLLGNATIRLSVIGLAVFWSVGQVLLAAFPAYAKATMAIDNTVLIQGLLAATGIGIALGSSLAARWSRGYIETGLIPLGACGIGIGLLLLTTLDSVVAHGLNLLFIGTMGGLFIVPLNALIQFSARSHELGKVLAGNNLVQNISMLFFLAVTAGFALAGLSSKALLQLITLVAIAGCAWTLYQLPQSLVRIMLSLVLTRRYRVDVQGLHNIPGEGGVLLLGNHISWIDWAIVQIATPRPVRFVMLKSIYQRWYLKWFFDLFGVIPIEQGSSSRFSLETVAALLNAGEVVCLFPEGAISRTGHLAEFRRGFEKACSQCHDSVVIVPFYLRGLWGSQFSRSTDHLRLQRSTGIYREIIVAFGEPLARDTTADIVKRRVFDISVDSWQQHIATLPTLPAAWIATSKRIGSELAIADTLTDPLSGNQALTAAIMLSRRILRASPEPVVGILLPTSAGGMLTNMAALLAGKTVVNLNFTAATDALVSAREQAGLQTVYTSRRFLERLESRGITLDPLLTGLQVIHLEELMTQLGRVEKLTTWLQARYLPAAVVSRLYCHARDPAATAAILFSSGSEGAPKGVMLSHRNIMANLKQISDVLNTRADDVVMASLPLFHAFGLTVTQFMPLIEGIPAVCHTDPTDAPGVARAIARYRATILCGTSTFFRLYTRNSKVHPLMLESLRVVVSGAEKLSEDVRNAFQLKFNKTVYEGYGATETTPVASVNLPDAMDTRYWQVQKGHKPGTVGMPLPGTSFKVVDPDSWEELPTGSEGMVLIGGSQVMQGYLNNPEKTAAVIREKDGVRWYATGDKGKLDSDGFLTIIDRYSRFAKIGGEMISLSAVEAPLRKLLGEEDDLVAVSLPDTAKGEQIVLLHTGEYSAEQLRQQLLADGVAPLMIPAAFYPVAEIPRLGSGKTDFGRAREIALACRGQAQS